MTQYTWETCSRVIQSEVNTLKTELQRLLVEQGLTGMYLHGSLALGGFNPTRSNINSIVVLRRGMDVEMKRTIVSLLLRISNMPCPLDIHFLVEQALFPFQHPLSYDFHYSEAQRERIQQDLRDGTWEQWNDDTGQDPQLTFAFFQHKVCLEPLATELPVVSEQDYRTALIEDNKRALAKPLHNPLAFVLNACRDVAYLHNGVALSKEAGGAWGLVNMPERYHPLILQMLTLYRGERPGRPVGQAALNAFVFYLQETISV